MPFGMVQLSPDTRTEGWDACGGYHYTDNSILGFSHNHFTGTGCPELGNILFTPRIGPGKGATAQPGAGLRFSHDEEIATPGYYRVVFSEPEITAELTATLRCGLHRYTFPPKQPANLVIDLRHGMVLANVLGGSCKIESDRLISGSRRSKGFAGEKTFYFVAEFSKPFEQVDFNVDGKRVEGKAASGKLVWAGLDFSDLGGKPLVAKVGLSAVSVEGARANLKAEAPEALDFDQAVSNAKAAWERQLSRIDAHFDCPADRETFYSALYHAHLCPNLFCDVDGAFWGPDGKSHASEGFPYYTSFSLWDTFRAEHPLLILTAPERVGDMIKTMLAHYRIFGKHNLPFNVYAGHETWCMIGNHSIPVIAEAYFKGIRGFDAGATLDAMLDSMNQDRNDLKEYRQRGYIAHDKNPRKQGVSKTLEYAYNDACVSRFAAMIGRADAAAANRVRRDNWRNVFDRKTGFMRGKTAEGKFVEPFDPREVTFYDYTESNAWQYAFFVPHNVPGLIEALGGDAAMVRQLDTLFTSSSEVPDTGTDTSDQSGMIGQDGHGNEPCHNFAYLYSYAGQPWKTQRWARQIMVTLYNNRATGLCGNDDCGQMSAWYVWSALGLYPVDPVSGVYVIGSPLVTSATIHLNTAFTKGNAFTITATDNSPRNIYIQSATLNGKPFSRSWISHEELAAGGHLVLNMGPRPNERWGADLQDRPPTLALTVDTTKDF